MKPDAYLLLISILFISFLSVIPATAEDTYSVIPDIPIAELTPLSIETAPSGAPGSPFFTGYTLTNTGNRPSGSFIIQMYLSPDVNVTTDDLLIWEKKEGFFSAGDTKYNTYIRDLPGEITPGTWYPALFIDVSELVPEKDEANNVITGEPVQITKEFNRPQAFYNTKIGDLIYRYTNRERNFYRLTPLTYDDDLALVAQDHSDDMSTRNFFNHINPDNENPSDRAKRHGYESSRVTETGDTVHGIAENIIKVPVGETSNYGYVDQDDIIAVAELMLDSWMHSSDHKENILNPHLRKIGIGVSFDGTRYYATQNMI